MILRTVFRDGEPVGDPVLLEDENWELDLHVADTLHAITSAEEQDSFVFEGVKVLCADGTEILYERKRSD